MSMVLPKEINYATPASLPEGTSSMEIAIAPSNGNTFGGSGQTGSHLIQFDLPQAHYLDPSSLYLRYRMTHYGASTAVHTIKKIPAYTFLQRMEILMGSQVVENINDYNVWCCLFSDLQLDIAGRYGLSSSFGLAGESIDALDSVTHTIPVGGSINQNYAIPLPCLLSAAERLVPLGMMPAVRVQINTETVANAFTVGVNNATDGTTTTVLPTGIQFSNLELVYTQISFSGTVDNMIKGTESFFIKSQSIAAMSNNISTGVLGTNDLVFNLRLASVKSIFSSFAPTSGTTTNGKFDSFDPTNFNGSLVYSLGGQNYPQKALPTDIHRNSILLELQKACGGLHSIEFNSSISALEWSRADGSGSKAASPGKFYFGANLEKVVNNQVLLSGISTQSSPIVLRLQCNTATTQAYNITMFAMYDALIQVNPMTRDASVKQ